jgi:hypothetical protein
MGRAVLVLNRKADRDLAAKWAMRAPVGTRVEWKATKRSLPQNARMWAMLTDVATQLTWQGNKLTTDEWKLMFLDGLKREKRLVQNLDKTGFVNLGRSSSDLSKDEMSDLMELISAFGAQHGVAFSEPESA